MSNKNPRKWRFTWEAQSHSPTLKLFLFDTHTNPSIQCHDLQLNLDLSRSLVSISWAQLSDSANRFSVDVPLPRVLVDPDSPLNIRALTEHIEVRLLLLLPVDHPIVSGLDSVLTESREIVEEDVKTPLVMDSDLEKLSALKEEGVDFYCRCCSTKLNRKPIRNFVEMPSVNWQEAADNWFGGCCCSFGGVSDKLVAMYAKSYICVEGMCLLTNSTITLCKDDLVGCQFLDWDREQKYPGEADLNVKDSSNDALVESGSNNGRITCCDNGSNIRHDCHLESRLMDCRKKQICANGCCEEGTTDFDSLFCTLSISESSENACSTAGCCGDVRRPTFLDSSLADPKAIRTMDLLADQKSFLNGFLGNIFMARSSNLSKDVEWIEFLCPHCSSLLGAYPCINGITPIDGGIRLFKCYVSTSFPDGGLNNVFKNYSLERMFTNQLLESAKEELSFRTVVRDLKSKSLLVQLILLNPNSWSCTGYCLDSDCSVGSMSKIDFHPIIKVLFADYRNYSESELRTLEDRLKKNQADEVFMFTQQVEELLEVLTSAKTILPPSCTCSIQGSPLSSLRR